jgi:hypothetical protein
MSLHLPSDNRSDDIVLQVVECTECSFQGIAVYEESRRGALEREAWDHTGYRMDSATVDSVAVLINSCPQPFSAGCQCNAHKLLGRSDARGRWRGLVGMVYDESFPMERAS